MAREVRQQLTENGELIEAAEKQPLSKAEKPKLKKEPEYYVFRLLPTGYTQEGKPTFPSVLQISPKALIWDDEFQTTRQAHFMDGSTTYWVDEQDKLPETMKRRRYEITFERGVLKVPSSNKLLVRYLMNRLDCRNGYAGQKLPRPKYELLNLDELDNTKLDKERKRSLVHSKALECSYDEMVNHCRYLGISLINEYQIEKSEGSLRADYASYALNNFDIFLKTINNPAVVASAIALKAISFDIIDVTDIRGQATWKNTSNAICQLEKGVKPEITIGNYLVSDRGKEAYERIKELLS
jgi:hypothetical protein